MKSFKKWFLIMLLLQIVILDVPTDSLRTTTKKGPKLPKYKEDIEDNLDDLYDEIDKPNSNRTDIRNKLNDIIKRKKPRRKMKHSESKKFIKICDKITDADDIEFEDADSLLDSIDDYIDNGVDFENNDERKEHSEIINKFSKTLKKLSERTKLKPTNCGSSLNLKCKSIRKKQIAISNFNLNDLKKNTLSKKCNSSEFIGYKGFDPIVNNTELDLKLITTSNLAQIINESEDENELATFYINACDLYKDDIRSIHSVIMKNNIFDVSSTQKISSYLISTVLIDSKNRTIKKNLNVNLQFNATVVSDKYECGFWDENNLVWSTSGCQFVKIEINGMYACKCDHTTFFGLIGKQTSASVGLSLAMTYTVLITFSILLGSVVIFIFGQKIINLNRSVLVGIAPFYTMLSALIACALFIIASIFMIVITFVTYNSFTTGCSVVVAFEHFFLLSYFFWLFNTVLMNYLTIKFKIHSLRKWFITLSIISFAIPFIITMVVFNVQFSDSSLTYKYENKICWLSEPVIISTIIVPIIIISMGNIIMIILVIRFKYLQEYKFKNSNKLTIFTILTCVLFSGITWIGLPFSLFMQNTELEVLLYFFTITNALQGFFIFFHFVVTVNLINKQAKNQNQVKIKKSTKIGDSISDIDNSYISTKTNLD